MFPIVHYYINKRIFGNPPALMVLGGLFPDLASSMGMERNRAHVYGRELYQWCCMHNWRQGLPFAVGALSHGIDPCGVDYYADEFWPGYRKGWCFMQGEPWMADIKRVTRLSENYLWWKSHNFVEIVGEMLVHDQDPQTSVEILAAANDESTLAAAGKLLSAAAGLDPQLVRDVYLRVPQIFALEKVTPQILAEKQCDSFVYRFGQNDGDPQAMAELLLKMKESLKDKYPPFLDCLTELTAQTLAEFPVE